MTTQAPTLVIPRKPVLCGTFAAIGYHAPTKTMDLEFRTGAVLRLTRVTSQEHAALLCAPSIASHYVRHVHGKFAAEPLVEAEDEGNTPD